MRLRSVWNRNRNSAGRYWYKHNIFDMNFKKKGKREPAIIWNKVNCQRITSKNTRPWWVDTWARDTVRWYWSADTLFWQLSIDDNIDVQSAFSWAPKVARKCESKHWYACGADGRSVGRSRSSTINQWIRALRGRSFITSRGKGGWRGGGGTIFQEAWFWGINFANAQNEGEVEILRHRAGLLC